MGRYARRARVVAAIGVLFLVGGLIDALFLASGLRPATDLEAFRPTYQELINFPGSDSVSTRHPKGSFSRPDYAAETIRTWWWDGAKPSVSDSPSLEIEVRQHFSAHLPAYFYSEDAHRDYWDFSPTVIVDTHVVLPGWDDQGSWADDCDSTGCMYVAWWGRVGQYTVYVDYWGNGLAKIQPNLIAKIVPPIPWH